MDENAINMWLIYVPGLCARIYILLVLLTGLSAFAALCFFGDYIDPLLSDKVHKMAQKRFKLMAICALAFMAAACLIPGEDEARKMVSLYLMYR